MTTSDNLPLSGDGRQVLGMRGQDSSSDRGSVKLFARLWLVDLSAQSCALRNGTFSASCVRWVNLLKFLDQSPLKRSPRTMAFDPELSLVIFMLYL